MSKERKRYQADYKAKVAVESIKEVRTVNELAQEYGLHPNQITAWKKELLKRAAEIFGRGKDKEKNRTDELIPRLYQEIGQLKVELDWLKKKVGQ